MLFDHWMKTQMSDNTRTHKNMYKLGLFHTKNVLQNLNILPLLSHYKTVLYMKYTDLCIVILHYKAENIYLL